MDVKSWRRDLKTGSFSFDDRNGMVTTTLEIKNLIGHVKHATSAARTWEQVRAVPCKTTTGSLKFDDGNGNVGCLPFTWENWLVDGFYNW